MLIEQDKNRFNYLWKGILTLFIYFFVSYFKALPFELLHINLEDVPAFTKNIYSMVLEILMIFIIYSIYEKEFRAAFDDIKKNHKAYFDKYFKVYLIGLVVMMLSNIVIQRLGGGISENESAIRNEFAIYPIYTFISGAVLAPILEEEVFRLGIKSMFKNNILYLLFSALIFGSLHLWGMPFNELFPLYLLSYSCMGIAFAYIVAKANNVLIPMGFHFMHNGIILSIQFFMMIFG